MPLLLLRLPLGARRARARVARQNIAVAAAVGWWVGQPGLIGQNQDSQRTSTENTMDLRVKAQHVRLKDIPVMLLLLLQLQATAPRQRRDI